MKQRKRMLSALLAIMLILTLLPSGPIVAADMPVYDALFMSDLHNGVGGYDGLKQMVSELKAEGLEPRVIGHGGDYVEDDKGGIPDWQTEVYDVISGTEKEAFPDAAQVYTMGNHDWETGTFGGRSDKEAAFKEIFGYDRTGLAYSDDEMEIYTIGAQGTTGAGGGGEAFIQADIDAFDQYLNAVKGSGKVIFLQTHWPAHSSYNFKQRVVTNSGLLIDVMNKYADQMDLVWIWGHNHYEDEMRYVILQPGDQIMYKADTTGSTWGNPKNPQYKTIQFTYANAGCMNDMWYLQDGRNDTSSSTGYRGPSACLSVAVSEAAINFQYNRIQQVNGEWVFSHDANIQIHNHNVTKEHPAEVSVARLVNPHAHDYQAAATVAPTCTDAGYTVYTCSICGASYQADAVAALGHSYADGFCTVCGAADPHAQPSPDNGQYVPAETIEPGKTYVIVANGKYALNNKTVRLKNQDSLGATAVTIKNGVLTSTVSEDMLWTIQNAPEGTSAAVDGAVQYHLYDQSGNLLYRRSGSSGTAPLSCNSEAPAKANHATWSFAVRNADAAEFTMYVNSSSSSDYPFTMSGSESGFSCPGTARSGWDPLTYGDAIQLYTVAVSPDPDVPACTHEYAAVTTDATCTEAGSTTYTCTLCGDSYTEPIPALGHELRTDVALAPTCTEPGLTQGRHCVRDGCGYAIAQEAIPALGHSYTNGFCSRCGAEDPDREKEIASPDDAQFVVSTATGKAGDTVTLTVSIENNPGIVSAYLKLYYDTEKLELIDAEDTGLLADHDFNLEVMPYSLNWDSSLSSVNNTNNGDIAILTFRIKDDCQPSDADIMLRFDPRNILDTNFDLVPFAVTDGTVHVVDYIPGDLDSDGEVTARDVALLRRYLAGNLTSSINLLAADCDGMPGITARDVGFLRRNLAYWEGYELSYPQ